MGRQRRDIPWLDTRDNGVFYAFWYDGEARQTRRESMETRDAAEARQKFGNFLLNGPRSALHVGDAGVTVRQCLDWYDVGVPGTKIQGHVEASVVDKERQRTALNNLKSFFGNTLVRNVDVPSTEEYARERREGKHGNGLKAGDATIRRELGALVSAARFCIKRDLLPPDQAPRVEKPAEPQRRAPWLSKDATRTLFEKSDGKLRAFCRLTYYWAARRRSVERLTINQIDLQHGRVDLHKPGKRHTKKRSAIVPIYAEIRRDIETLMLDTNSEFLFGNPEDFYHQFVALCAREKIAVMDMPADTTPWPHLLRHSRATHMLMDGEDLFKVAKLLGDTVATVEKVYGHHSPEYLMTKSNVEVR